MRLPPAGHSFFLPEAVAAGCRVRASPARSRAGRDGARTGAALATRHNSAAPRCVHFPLRIWSDDLLELQRDGETFAKLPRLEGEHTARTCANVGHG